MFDSLFISSTHNIYFLKVLYDREDELVHFLKKRNIDLSELNTINNSKRRMEWLSIRKVITQVLPKNDIIYSKDRKPFFNNSSFHLSISHSSEMIAISIDELTNTGVDIQLISSKIQRIKHKFLSETELIKLETNTNLLTCYWCIKEALFKIYGKKDAYLKENIEIDTFSFDGVNGSATGTINANNYTSSHQLSLKMIGNYILAYIVNS